MKNWILLLMACAAFIMTGSVKAQITVNSSQVEISKPLFVAKVKKASLNIYSNTGKLVRSYILSTESRSGGITVKSYSLAPSIYTYSLLVDDRIVDTKRMVITK